MLDRTMQHQILKRLEEVYPAAINIWPDEDEDDTVLPNVYYLREHGLIAIDIFESIGGSWSWGDAQITARGMDFLADDGGLSAVLGTVTVRLHADTLRTMMIAQVEKSSASPEEKRTLRERLATLPETALQAATTQLVGVGLTHMPDAIQWLGKLVGL